MGAIFSRTGTDSYYANYEKSFERLEKESEKVLTRRVKRRKTMGTCSNIGFWTVAVGLCVAVLLTAYLQQVSSQRWYQKSITILGAFAVPLTSALLFKGILWLLRFAESRDERFLRKLMDAKRKMVKELKDSTRFEKTAALIKKFDPDEQVPSPRSSLSATSAGPGAPGGLRRRAGPAASGGDSRGPSNSQTPRSGTVTPGAILMRPAAVAASAAVSVAAETGKALMPMFESLANNLVGDSPVLVQEAHQLRQENTQLRVKVAELEALLAKQQSVEEKPAEQVEQTQLDGPEAAQVAPSV